ncbi:hypothetical protein IZ6_07590 [Terrihabitans soli]|uniref:Uncharacterized protein n=1 Tax=Terrihabitans soli TaxID=708113 RepID=A0A6S6QIH0_9HYPH|nr:hypothetical protein [Terrihabitans soli]BCJ90024.1 hypothetical protein IZ6_07590 [Terrihabitans soli]
MADDIVNLGEARRRRDATAKALADEGREEAAIQLDTEAQEPRAAWLEAASWCVRCPHCEFAIAVPLPNVAECETSARFEPRNESRFVCCGACGLRDIRVGPITIMAERIEP